MIHIYANVHGNDTPLLTEIRKLLVHAPEDLNLRVQCAGDIRAGTVRSEWFRDRIEQADLMLVLFSAGMLADRETTGLLRNFLDKNPADRLIPVVARACMWDVSFGHLEVLPEQDRSVSEFEGAAKERVLVKIAKAVIAKAKAVAASKTTT